VSENGPLRPESADPLPKTRTWVLVVVLLMSPGALYAAIFWVAALFVGEEAISRYRRYFDPRAWFRKR
jgi:hypothetical protein